MDQSIYPTWLGTLGFRAPGIGALNDLKHTIVAGEQGKWLSFVNPGWYYLDGEEKYYYNQPLSSTGTGTITSSEDSYWPQRGPVLASNNTGQLVQIDNVLLAAQSVSWSSLGDNLYSATHSATHSLLNVRGLDRIALSSAPATGYLAPDISYYYDEGVRTVYVKSTSSPINRIFLDYYTASATLDISEALYTDWESKVYPTYSQYTGLVLTRGADTQNIGTGSGGIETTIATQGEWVRASYQVPNSYMLSNHKTVLTNATGTTTVEFEGTIPGFVPAIQVANDPNEGAFNLNPMLQNSPFVGYLFVDSSAPTYTAGRVSITTDRDKYRSTAGEEVKFVITIYSPEKIPIPWKDIQFTLTGHDYVTAQFPEPAFDSIYDYTDAAGRKIIYCTGTGDITLSVTCDGASGSITVQAEDLWVPDRSKYLDGNLSITTTPSKISQTDYFECYFNASNLDGVPSFTNNDPAVIYLQRGVKALVLNSLGVYVTHEYSADINTDLSGANPIGMSEKFGLSESTIGFAWAYRYGATSKKVKAVAGDSW